jgi:hypothetical protein
MDRTTLILLASAVVTAATRAFNEDLPVFKNLTKPVRAVIAAALAIVSATVDNLSTPGSTFQSAIVTAFGVAGPSFLLLVIEAIGGGGGGGSAVAVHVATPAPGKSAGPYSAAIVNYPAMLLASFAIAIGMLLCGCSGSLEAARHTTPTLGAAPDSPTCVALDSQHRTWGALAEFAGVVAGVGGLSTLPIPADDKTARTTVAISSIVVGAFAATAVYVEQDAASTWARECTVGAK